MVALPNTQKIRINRKANMRNIFFIIFLFGSSIAFAKTFDSKIKVGDCISIKGFLDAYHVSAIVQVAGAKEETLYQGYALTYKLPDKTFSQIGTFIPSLVNSKHWNKVICN